MSAFVPAPGLSRLSGSPIGTRECLTHRNPFTHYPRPAPLRMVSYPYTGSGYGAAGIPYAGDQVGQSFRQTTTQDIINTAASIPIFSTLVSLLRETGLDYELAKGGPFTLFAPTNTAFASLLEPHGFAMLASLLRPENREELRKVLAYHVIPGEVSSGAVMACGKMVPTTLAGVPITVMGYGKRVTAGSAPVVKADIPCNNGVIHVVSSVLIPSSFERQPAGPVRRKFPNSLILDIYANTLTPRQALGIDPLPAGYQPGALSKFE